MSEEQLLLVGIGVLIGVLVGVVRDALKGGVYPPDDKDGYT